MCILVIKKAYVWGGKLILPSWDYCLVLELTIKKVFEVSLAKYFINTIKSGNIIINAGKISDTLQFCQFTCLFT